MNLRTRLNVRLLIFGKNKVKSEGLFVTTMASGMRTILALNEAYSFICALLHAHFEREILGRN